MPLFLVVLPFLLSIYSTHGPLIHTRAVEKVIRHVEDAVSKGAQILVGGKHIPNTSFFYPTVLSDVSSEAVLATGGVLLMDCEDGLWRPVAFLSKSLNETERNYEIHDKKMLAIIRGLEA